MSNKNKNKTFIHTRIEYIHTKNLLKTIWFDNKKYILWTLQLEQPAPISLWLYWTIWNEIPFFSLEFWEISILMSINFS